MAKDTWSSSAISSTTKPKAQGGDDSLGNLRVVHPECHKRSSLEQREFGNRPRIGISGFCAQAPSVAAERILQLGADNFPDRVEQRGRLRRSL